MQIGGLIKLSLIDYPGKPSAVVFTQGCNFRCPFCHNKDLVVPECFDAPIPEEDVLEFLEKRRNLLEGVVISGGEPTIQEDLTDFLTKIKAKGFDVKLDTNGSQPHVLMTLIAEGLVNFIAMDIKAPPEKYSKMTGGWDDFEAIQESVALIKNSGIEHEFRTTMVKTLLGAKDIPLMAGIAGDPRNYKLQNFAARESLITPALAGRGAFSDEEFQEFQKRM